MKIVRLLILGIAILFPIFSSASDLPVNKIVVFGDSLSDNGNLYALYHGLIPKSPPYYKGRFSNGPVWAENMADFFQDKSKIETDNYALGGETVINYDLDKHIQSLYLELSVLDYYAHSLLSDRSKTLFVIWIGGNDYLRAPIDDVEKLSTDVVTTLKATIQDIIDKGGEYFLILNLPDMGKSPYARVSKQKEILSQATAAHNKKLKTAIAQLQADNSNVVLKAYDTNALFSDMLAHPDSFNKKYGTHLQDSTSACWEGGYTSHQLQSPAAMIARELSAGTKENSSADKLANLIISSPDLNAAYAVQREQAAGIEPCKDPGALIFWDSVHPTDAVHSIISHIIDDYIQNNYSYK
jgi:phospholipase/lecithinase/hemolysin